MEMIGVSRVKSSCTLELIGDNKKYLAVCLAFLFAFLSVLLFRDHLRAFDLALNNWVPTLQSGWTTTVAVGISYVFDTYSLLVASLVIASYLFYKNYRLQSLLLLGAMGGDALLVVGFKLLVHSPRPLNALIVDSGYSFPSGHTVGSIVFCGLLTYFAWQYLKNTRPRVLVIALAASIVALVGFDRIYLNVHWFSDVLGGCLLGVFWLAISVMIFKLLTVDKKPLSDRFEKLSIILFFIAVIVAVGLLIESFVPLHLWIGTLTGLFQGIANTVTLLTTIGYIGLFIVVFAESGVFVGFFLPGDSLLFTAGILSSQGFFSIYSVVSVVIAGAILGDNFGYAFGRTVGPMFVKKDTRFLNTKRVESVKAFFERHGSKTIVIARFVPVARTFAPILAGASKMQYRTFLSYNMVGGLLWGLALPLVGFVAGITIPDIGLFIYPVIAIIVVVSVLPWAVKFLRKSTEK